MNATQPAARPPSKTADRAAPHVRIPVNLDVSNIKPPHLKMLLILEAFWGDKTYCWPSNETLAKKFGCSLSRARQILYEMEDLGYIYLLPADQRKPHGERAGIFAHYRLNPDRPVEDRPPPPEAIERLWAARAKSLGTGVPPCRNSDNPPCRNPAKPLVGIPTPSKEYSLSLNQKHSEPRDASLDQRQRKDPPEPEPLPIVLAQETLAAVHPPIEPAPIVAADVPELPAEPPSTAAEPTDQAGAVEVLTAGQEAFLATLDADQRATFDALPADRRAQTLAPHALGYDRVIGADQAVKLSPLRRVELPPIPSDDGRADRAIARFAAGTEPASGRSARSRLRREERPPTLGRVPQDRRAGPLRSDRSRRHAQRLSPGYGAGYRTTRREVLGSVQGTDGIGRRRPEGHDCRKGGLSCHMTAPRASPAPSWALNPMSLEACPMSA